MSIRFLQRNLVARHNQLLRVKSNGQPLERSQVAHTMSKKVTPMTAREAVTANLVTATLVTVASTFALPVSTTHVTSGGLFGIGMLRREEANWGKVREILLAWAATLPLGAVLASLIFTLVRIWPPSNATPASLENHRRWSLPVAA